MGNASRISEANNNDTAVGALVIVLAVAAEHAPEAKEAFATHEGETHCPADLNASTWIDITDITYLTNSFGLSAPPVDPAYDLVPSGYIDITDIVQVTGSFGLQCFPPSPPPPLPPEAYTPVADTQFSAEECSDWQQTESGGWVADCAFFNAESDWGLQEYYYWDPDSQTAILYYYCSGGIMSWYCCGVPGACQAARAASEGRHLYL